MSLINTGMKIQIAQPVTFEAMKPNQFKGFDYACVRKFKAPVEKFETEMNLYGWAYSKLNEIVHNKCIPGKSPYTKTRRQESIFEWRNVLGFDLKDAPLALIVLAPMLKELKNNNDTLPPILSSDVLRKTIEDLKKNLDINKDFQFNFKTLYFQNLKQKMNNQENNDNGWIKIPSKEHDPQNYNTNVDKLKVLSNNSWCTKNYHANLFLKFGDFYILLEEGKPKIGLAFEKNMLIEIQSERNDGILDLKYFNAVNDFIGEKGCALKDKAFETYHEAKKQALKLKKYNNDLKEAIANRDNFKIFEYLEYEPILLADGTISINEYRIPTEEFSFEDLGINEEILFEDVSEIRGDCDFSDSKLKTLKKIKQILGTVYFSNSAITELGELEFIKEDVHFDYSQITSLGNLKKIGGTCSILNSHISNLGNLEYIGENLNIGYNNTIQIPEKLTVEGIINSF